MQQILLSPYISNAHEVASMVEAINTLQPKWEVVVFPDEDQKKHGRKSRGNESLPSRVFSRCFSNVLLIFNDSIQDIPKDTKEGA